MRPSIAWFLWALASSSTDAAAIVSVPAPPATLEELELAAASTPDLYLRLEVSRTAGAPSRLSIKARGLVLDRLPVADFVALEFRRGLSSSTADLVLPRSFRVEVEPEGSHRRRVEPPQLKPYQEDAAVGGAPAPAAEPQPPAAYEVGLDGGWRLRVTQQPLVAGLGSRVFGAFAEGVRRLAGKSSERPPKLVLVVSEEDGRRLHHLFRKGTRLIVHLAR